MSDHHLFRDNQTRETKLGYQATNLKLHRMNMQPMEEAISDMEWTTLTGMYHNTDEDFMAQLLHNIDLGLGSGSGLEMGDSVWYGNHQTSFHTQNSTHGFPQTSLYNTFPNGSTGHHFHDQYLNLMTPNSTVLCGGGSPSVEPDVIDGDDSRNDETEEKITNSSSSSSDMINGRKRSRSAENVSYRISLFYNV